MLITAEAIPVVSALAAHSAVAATLAAAIVVSQGFQQLNQDQQNWISYRSTCEALRPEKFLFLAGAGPYAGAEDGVGCCLADRIEGFIRKSTRNALLRVMRVRVSRGSRADIGLSQPQGR